MNVVISLVGLAVYTNVYYYTTYNPKFQEIYKHLPAAMAAWGQWAFLTHQCLVMQMISMTLHLIGAFYKPIIPFRDGFFTTLAMPASGVVVLSFWIVYAVNPELILPAFVRDAMPPWANHSVHTVPLIVNLLLITLTRYEFPQRGYLAALCYLVFYFGLMFLVKFESGYFPYPYIDAMSPWQVALYFVANGAFLTSIYYGEKFVSRLIHGNTMEWDSQARGHELNSL